MPKSTAFHYAAKSGSVDIIKLLLDKGISLNLTKTPLHFSAQFDHLEATKMLVDRGTAINKINRNSKTPLMVSAQKGNFQILRYLKNRR
jgi:ankyrin repeat protein